MTYDEVKILQATCTIIAIFCAIFGSCRAVRKLEERLEGKPGKAKGSPSAYQMDCNGNENQDTNKGES